MSTEPDELNDLAVKFPDEHMDRLAALASQVGMPLDDIVQEARLIILEKFNEYDQARASLLQFVFGHLRKRMRRQIGAHRYAVSLDRSDAVGEETRRLAEALHVPVEDEFEHETSVLAPSGAEKLLDIAAFVSGKSVSHLAQRLNVTPRRVRQILQKLREDDGVRLQTQLNFGKK
ncbi:hypothetical protein QPK31_07255 [Massilia sp. YIM B02769]|uniref:hypothetical protein n=1 Tax=Massilia sp. YIM B02769 TaxID=3050129 RepID=UPI0025B6588E|nr:hypothetical protein [Massilia sp. YIM B02769]MDN4058025.1 hypothetical protein [Massilia sp. YIM B02769]